MNAICPNCGAIELAVNQQIGGRLVLTAAGATIGTRALKNPWVAIALTIAGYALGMWLDKEVTQRCPQCGAVLRIVGLLP
jgi:predicted RNA-binding Zn-ribbon protein involved in translation (DUF1610 family)